MSEKGEQLASISLPPDIGNKNFRNNLSHVKQELIRNFDRVLKVNNDDENNDENNVNETEQHIFNLDKEADEEVSRIIGRNKEENNNEKQTELDSNSEYNVRERARSFGAAELNKNQSNNRLKYWSRRRDLSGTKKLPNNSTEDMDERTYIRRRTSTMPAALLASYNAPRNRNLRVLKLRDRVSGGHLLSQTYHGGMQLNRILSAGDDSV